MSYSKTFIGDKVTDFDYAPKNPLITGVNVTLDDGTEVFVGTEGNVLEVSVPVCNSTDDAETYGNYILSALSSYRYQPYSSSGAILDPAVQLGDGVNIRAIYGGVYYKNTAYGRLMKADVSSPFDKEVNSEYPYVSNYARKQTRKYVRLEDSMESEFSVQATQIAAKVSKLSPTGQTSFSWAMNDTSHVWYANGTQVMKVDASGLEVNGKVTATSGTIGGCTIENGVLKVTSANIDSIQIGTNFSVDAYGNMYANNATITGTLMVGGNPITATSLYTGAYQSASNYGTWSTGAGYGYNYNTATQANGTGAGFFHTGYLFCSRIYLNNTQYSPKQIKVMNEDTGYPVTIYYLGT